MTIFSNTCMAWFIKCTFLLSMVSFYQGYSRSFIPLEQDTAAFKSRLFNSEDYLELKIVIDFDSLLNDKGDNPSYHSARLSYKNADSTWISLDAQIRVRGSFRRQSENCDFPPLKLRFDKESRINTIFENVRELKMVTHCQSDTPDYDQYVIQEYLIYKLYEVLSDINYKTRLLNVTYIDRNDPGVTLRKFSFFVEDQDDMEGRLNGHMIRVQTVIPKNIDWDRYVIISFFEYMIINTDWSLPIMHNVDLISLDYFKPPVPVPFDFDWSGLISIPYKVPTAAGMQIRIPERVYKGPCLTNKEAKRFKRIFEEKETDLYNVYYHCPYLDDEIKIKTINKLRLFYQILEDKYIFNSVFIDSCK
jgi:hypothetical protein